MRLLSLSLLGFSLFACGGDGGNTGGGTGGAGGSGGAGGGGGSVAGCTAQNCAGCCLSGACQPGSTAAACGKNGSACAACSANQICRVEQTCGVDPDSMWKVQPTAATITPNNNGSSWDGDNSAPDVVIRLDCPPFSTTTFDSSTPEASSYNPTWNSGGCTAKASDLLTTGFQFQAFDIDAFSDDTVSSVLSYKPTEADFVSGSFTLQPSGGLQSLTVQLQKQ
ncbi:MAG: hypothetical protein ACOZIN_08600 [Myxococcota bacterium]